MTDTPDRILTTHTGSLPRPEDLIQIMWAVGDGIPVDQDALSERVRRAQELGLESERRGGDRNGLVGVMWMAREAT